MKSYVITLSDRAYNGVYQDTSGPLLIELLKAHGYENVGYVILPDDKAMLSAKLIELADSSSADLVITTGGTGFASRDITPEATLAVAERNAPGISEALRSTSPRSMLSRGASVIRKRTLIVNLPGSERAVRECAEIFLEVVKHGLEVLRGETSIDCGH